MLYATFLFYSNIIIHIASQFHFYSDSQEYHHFTMSYSQQFLYLLIYSHWHLEWPLSFFKAGFSLILHALLVMNNHSDRNFKNLNKTSAVCIKLESNLIFMILGSFCRELWGVSNDVKITKITQQTMKITQYYELSQASMLSLTDQVRFWKLSLT